MAMRDLKKRQNSPKDHAGLFEAQHHWTHYRRCVCPLNEKHSDPARPEDMEDVSRKDAETFG